MNHPKRVGNAKINIDILVPNLFLMNPDITQDIAAPIGIMATAQANSVLET